MERDTSNEVYLEIVNTTGQTSVSTELINKKLDAIIIETKEKTEVLVESELGYFILSRKEHQGVSYYCPRIRTTTPIEDLKDKPSFEKFNLNEKLIVTVMGRKRETIKVLFRFS